MNIYLALKKRIKKNEGFSRAAYSDSLGFDTIGYGHLIKDSEKELLSSSFSKRFLLNLFYLDFNKALIDYERLYKKQNHQLHVAEVLIEMIFQIGINKQKKFIKMNKHIKKNQFFMAALEMKNSLWHIQTPKRVDGLINILLKHQHEK